jgi:hypothetical protein
VTAAILIWFLLLVATVFRLVSGELPSIENDYGENPNANEWEIR